MYSAEKTEAAPSLEALPGVEDTGASDDALECNQLVLSQQSRDLYAEMTSLAKPLDNSFSSDLFARFGYGDGNPQYTMLLLDSEAAYAINKVKFSLANPLEYSVTVSVAAYFADNLVDSKVHIYLHIHTGFFKMPNVTPTQTV